MSSTLESAVAVILDDNYASLVILTAIGYDYILTFSDEIEYVWNKPWTWVSTLFILVRYFGLCIAIIDGFLGKLLDIFASWSSIVFFGAADLVMILRVWALYNRSRIVFGTLLMLYALEIIAVLVVSIAFIIPNIFEMFTFPVLDLSFCALRAASPIWTEVHDYLEFVLAVVMCLLVIAQFIQRSFQMYRTSKTWQSGRYANLFAKEGILYFLAMVLYNLANILPWVIFLPTTTWCILLIGIMEYVPIFTLTPRFILNVRAMYARDVRGQRGSHIDSDFGFTSAFGRGAGGSAMIFAAGAQDEEGLEQAEEIPMGERDDQKDDIGA